MHSPDRFLSARRLVWLAVAVIAVGCGGGADGIYVLPDDQVQQYDTAYLAEVVAAPEEGDDLDEGAGEHVVIRNNWDHRTDMGGWYIETDDGVRLPLGIGRQIDPDAELRVHSSCGENTDEAVFVCLDDEALDDDGGVLVLRDSAGAEVARFAYGSAS
ncbi:MAG: lamin tail domain-containing protein [Actinobacteria bacterium]|nr:lamin tail domain-containing protein [Actinomycetota bacterium]